MDAESFSAFYISQQSNLNMQKDLHMLKLFLIAVSWQRETTFFVLVIGRVIILVSLLL